MSQLQQDLIRRTPDDVRLDRRALLTGAVAFASATGAVSAALGRDYGTDQPQRYPDPDVVILDNRFAGKVWNTSIERTARSGPRDRPGTRSEDT